MALAKVTITLEDLPGPPAGQVGVFGSYDPELAVGDTITPAQKVGMQLLSALSMGVGMDEIGDEP